jgi:glycosyltransferase involved in cell wall biosynthesis
MKICLINNLYYPFTRGGAEQVVKNIAEGFKADGQDVFIISSRPLFRRVDKKINGIKTVRFFPWNIFWVGNINRYQAFFRLVWHFFDVFNFYSFLKVRAILKKEKPDLVITHNLKGIGYLVPLAVKSLGIKYFHTIHDVQLVNPSGLIIAGKEDSWDNKCILTKIYQKINKILFSYPQVLISPSKWLMDFYCDKGFFKKARKSIIPNPAPNIKSPTASYQLPATNKLLYIGQLENHKGILFLIEALSELGEDYELLIAGSGNKESIIKEQVKKNDKIKFLGKIENKEVLDLYNKVSLTIVPSLCYENSPMVIYESLAAGTPVLASNIGGVGELIVEGENGYTFTPGNKKDFLEKIKIFLRSREKLPQMKRKAFDSISRHTVENYLRKIKDHL